MIKTQFVSFALWHWSAQTLPNTLRRRLQKISLKVLLWCFYSSPHCFFPLYTVLIYLLKYILTYNNCNNAHEYPSSLPCVSTMQQLAHKQTQLLISHQHLCPMIYPCTTLPSCSIPVFHRKALNHLSGGP